MMTHSYAVRIEHIMSTILKCERFGAANLANADVIERNWYGPVFYALGYLAAQNNTCKEAVEKYIEKYAYYFQFDMRTLLHFESNTQIIDGSSWEIGYNNGKEAVESIISDFRDLAHQYSN